MSDSDRFRLMIWSIVDEWVDTVDVDEWIDMLMILLIDDHEWSCWRCSIDEHVVDEPIVDEHAVNDEWVDMLMIVELMFVVDDVRFMMMIDRYIFVRNDEWIGMLMIQLIDDHEWSS